MYFLKVADGTFIVAQKEQRMCEKGKKTKRKKNDKKKKERKPCFSLSVWFV